MHFRVLSMQPANRAPCPLTIETFGSLNVGSFVKGAVTGKYAMGSKNTGDKFECRKLIRKEVNCITEKYSVCILDDLGKIGSLSLDEIDFHLYPLRL